MPNGWKWDTAKELAEAAGETYDAINYWAEKGLLVFKRKGRRRFFDRRENLSRIKEIRRLQAKGFSAEAISERLRGSD